MHVIGAMIAYHYLYLYNCWDDISALYKLISHDDYASLLFLSLILVRLNTNWHLCSVNPP